MKLRLRAGRSARLGGLAAVLVASAAMLVFASPSAGIVNGTNDQTHTFVGALVVHFPDYGWKPVCTGTLIAPTVFLTAGHCIAFADAMDVSADPSNYAVVFDSKVFDGSGYPLNPVPADTVVQDPEFGFSGQGGMSDPHDMAVITFKGADAPKITPATLPTEGMLDALAKKHSLKGLEFTFVGYGASEVTASATPCLEGLCGTRNTTHRAFQALEKSWLRTSSYPNPVNSPELYYGDSGGPFLLDDTVVATFVGGPASGANAAAYRLDSPSAQAFLESFVTLP